MTLVKQSKIAKDPRNLPYLFPSMPIAKYKKIADDFYKHSALKSLEDAARINHQLLIPAHCLHWQRKKKFTEQNVRVFGRSYYLIDYDDLTDLEITKYENTAQVLKRA
jgi:hypothetical protein